LTPCSPRQAPCEGEVAPLIRPTINCEFFFLGQELDKAP
jgi:hypothetical protein